MAAAFRLRVLLELAQHRLDAAARDLQRARAHWDEAQEKLAHLQGYETEYRSALDARLARGMPAPEASDFRLFLDKLARAIRAQGEEVERRQGAWQEEQARWLGLRQKQQALSVLAQRHDAAQAVVEGRREQKEQDEFALRALKDSPARE
jgi:flagellar protein FliJ